MNTPGSCLNECDRPKSEYFQQQDECDILLSSCFSVGIWLKMLQIDYILGIFSFLSIQFMQNQSWGNSMPIL